MKFNKEKNYTNMKKEIKSLLIIGLFLTIPIFSFAQNPPHPNGGGGPGSGNTPVGGGAPIGSGLLIMLSLAAGWGVKKTYSIIKDQKDVK